MCNIFFFSPRKGGNGAKYTGKPSHGCVRYRGDIRSQGEKTWDRFFKCLLLILHFFRKRRYECQCVTKILSCKNGRSRKGTYDYYHYRRTTVIIQHFYIVWFYRDEIQRDLDPPASE